MDGTQRHTRQCHAGRYGDLSGATLLEDAQLDDAQLRDSASGGRRAPSPQRLQVRLTPRGRLLAVALFLALSFVIVSISSALHSATQAGTAPATPATRFVTVQPGQTLWQIALRVAPRDDPRDTVDRIRTLNGLDTTAVLPGQRLVVPA